MFNENQTVCSLTIAPREVPINSSLIIIIIIIII